MKSSSKWNIDEDEVRRSIVEPWEQGQEIVVGGKVFDPTDCEIRILEGPRLDPQVIRGPTAWLLATERSDDATDRFIVKAPGSSGTAPLSPDRDPRRVAVVHGRDSAAVDATFELLRDLDLHPVEWTELTRSIGSGAPHNKSVVDRLFDVAQAVLVLLTPDEETRLHPDLVPAPDVRGDGAWRCQARANVLLEAGMALALHPERTIFVEIGTSPPPSDLAGINVVRIDGTAPPLHDLAGRLATAGCAVDQGGSSWLRTKRFALLQARLRLPSMQG